jgi:hypothetical protein
MESIGYHTVDGSSSNDDSDDNNADKFSNEEDR